MQRFLRCYKKRWIFAFVSLIASKSSLLQTNCFPAISFCWFINKRDKATDEHKSVFGHRRTNYVMRVSMVPNAFPVQIYSKSCSKVQSPNKFFNIKLINQSKMRIFVGLFKEVWKSFSTSLNYGIGIMNTVLDDFFYEEQCESFDWSFCAFCHYLCHYLANFIFSCSFVKIVSANSIPGDIKSFLGIAALESTILLGWQCGIVIPTQSSVQIFELLCLW